MPEIEMNTGHQATPASAPVENTPAPAPSPTPAGATVVNDGEARRDTSNDAAAYAPKEKITPESWAEKAARHSGKKPKKFVAPKEPAAPKIDPREANQSPTPPVAKADEPAAAEEKEDGEPAAAAAPAAYKPNLKFNALGKEFDLPEWAAKGITDEKSEKEIKEVFEKAHGLEHVKMRNTELSKNLENVSGEHEVLVDGVKELSNIYKEAVETGNAYRLRDFFSKLKIPREVILQYAAAEVEYMEMEAGQRQMVDNQLRAQQEAREQRAQSSQFQNSAYQAEVRARTIQLDTVLAKPEIAAAVQAFESQPGRKPGDFKMEVVRNGRYAWTVDKVDLSVEENLNQVIQRFGLNALQAPAPQAQQAPQAQAQPNAQAPAAPQAPAVIPAAHQKVPVIPSVNGRNTSPTKQKPASIADLRELAKKTNSQSSRG